MARAFGVFQLISQLTSTSRSAGAGGSVDSTGLLTAFNPLVCEGNYSATSNNMKLVHQPLMGGLLHLVQR